MCKVYTGYCGTSEIEHGLCACTVNNPLAKARGLSLRIGAQPMLYLPLIANIVVFWGGGGGGFAMGKPLSGALSCIWRSCMLRKQVSYSISSDIRQTFFSFQNNPKDLDPSYKMDLDL